MYNCWWYTDSGGTIANAVDALKKWCQRSICIYYSCSFGDAVKKLKIQKLKLIITDTIDNSQKLKITIKLRLSIASLMSEAIKE